MGIIWFPATSFVSADQGMFIVTPIKNVQLTSALRVQFDWQLLFKFRNKIICVSRHCFNFIDALPYRVKKKGGVVVIWAEEKLSLSLCYKSCIMFINSCSTKCMNNKGFMQVQISLKFLGSCKKWKGSGVQHL